MKKFIPILFLFAGCQVDQIIPTCDFIEATRSGSKVSIRIISDAPVTTMCRDFGNRISCTDIVSDYYGCIRIEANNGEVIRFESYHELCQIIIK